MENRQEKSALVLKYGKRRFDGGNEIELIRTIERQKALKQLNQLQKEHLNEVQMEVAIKSANETATNVQDNPITTQVTTPSNDVPVISQKKRILEACCIGPLTICIGCVGILTSLLAIVTFSHLKNEPMLQQSRQVFKDCQKTLCKGLLDSLTTPVRIVKLLRTNV